MSQEGKIKRGKVYWDKRGREDVLPKAVAQHAGIMTDVNAYLDSIKPVEKVKKEK